MKTDPTVKPNSLRDNLRYRPEAIARGWRPELSIHDQQNGIDPAHGVSAWPVQFHRKEKALWLVRDGWRCADIVPGPEHYANHRTHPDLVTALEKES